MEHVESTSSRSTSTYEEFRVKQQTLSKYKIRSKNSLPSDG